MSVLERLEKGHDIRGDHDWAERRGSRERTTRNLSEGMEGKVVKKGIYIWCRIDICFDACDSATM